MIFAKKGVQELQHEEERASCLQQPGEAQLLLSCLVEFGNKLQDLWFPFPSSLNSFLFSKPQQKISCYLVLVDQI
jgi:hypothetical protein